MNVQRQTTFSWITCNEYHFFIINICTGKSAKITNTDRRTTPNGYSSVYLIFMNK